MAKKKKKNNKYYYAFVAIVLIIVILVAILDYNFRFGIVNWDEIFVSETESEKESQKVNVAGQIGNLTVTFIDVGQGDAILINFPDGTNMLVDAGENGSEDELEEHLVVNGEKLVLDYVVATHTDSDHIGAMDYVYENYTVKYSYRPYVKFSGASSFPEGFKNEGYNPKASNTYKNYLNGVANEGTENVFFTDSTDINVLVETETETIEYKVDFVMPYAKTVEGFKDFSDSNDFSSVMIIEFAGRKIMLTGDMEKDAEAKFVDYYTLNPEGVNLLDCDVLKVAHHGSATSSTSAFLDLIKPEHSVISCGVCHGIYKHPKEEALNNLIGVSSKIYRTDLQGTVTLVITPSGEMSFTTQTHEFDEYLLNSAEELEQLNMKEEIKNFKTTL